MRNEINEQERLRFRKDSTISMILLSAVIILPIPLAILLGWYGIALSVFFSAITLFYALRVARYEKKYDIKTFKEILAFREQESLEK